MTAPDFHDQVAIVTGAAQGIGRACALALAEAGVAIVVADLDLDTAAVVAGEIRESYDVEARPYQVDIAGPDQCRALVHEAGGHGRRLSVLVNCAAMYREAPALDQDPDEWAEVIDVGLNGAFYMSQAFARSIGRIHGGSIVNISSVTATHSMRHKAAYGAAKAALDSMTRSLALEWAPLNIRVNAVAPSHTATKTILRLARDGILPVDQIARRIPLGRLAEPAEVADTVIFLCSERARFITGQIIAVDGGYTANGDI
ncbi:MAG: SDR family NAD(P)-dependent oxidoreductase [Acidimicrobiales bacterium]